MYGWRARLGVVIPAIILAVEPEFELMKPEGVSCHFQRFHFDGGGLEGLKAIENVVADAAGMVCLVRPTAVAMCCTGGSFAGGYGYDRKLIQKMQEKMSLASHSDAACSIGYKESSTKAGECSNSISTQNVQGKYGNLPTTTASTSIIDALKVLNAKKISMAVPYVDEIAAVEKKFIEDHGIRVKKMKNLGIDGFAMNEVPYETVYRLAKESDDPESEAIFISCVGLHTVEIIEALETDLQKPVISSNQACMWNLLRMSNIKEKVHGFGKLLSEY